MPDDVMHMMLEPRSDRDRVGGSGSGSGLVGPKWILFAFDGWGDGEI